MSEALIIGAGLGGLCVARGLLRNGWSVRLIEERVSPGGLCGDIDVGGIRVERYYHHVFKAELEVQDLIREMGLSGCFRWHNVTRRDEAATTTSPGVTGHGGTLGRLVGNVRFGMELLAKPDITRLDDRTALDWLGNYFRPVELDELWVPLLRKKFGRYYADVSAWWLADRIMARLSSSNFIRRTERLGYLDGGFGRLTDALAQEIVAAGGIIESDTAVTGIQVSDGLVTGLHTSRGGIDCRGRVVSTIPRPVLASMEGFPLDAAGGWPPYMACICPVLVCRKPVSPHYWVSVGSSNPFVAIVEQSKFCRHEGRSVIYLPDYVESDPPPSGARIAGAADVATSALSGVIEGFDVGDVLWTSTSFDRYCQPVFLKGGLARRGTTKGLPRNLLVSDPLDDYPNQTRGMAATIRRAAAVVAAAGRP